MPTGKSAYLAFRLVSHVQPPTAVSAALEVISLMVLFASNHAELDTIYEVSLSHMKIKSVIRTTPIS